MTIYQDATLPHQMRMVADKELDLIGVSCNCMGDGDGLYGGDWQGDQPRTCGHTRRAYGACVREPVHPGWHRNVTGEEWPQYTEDRDLDAILNGPSYRTPAIELPGRGI